MQRTWIATNLLASILLAAATDSGAEALADEQPSGDSLEGVWSVTSMQDNGRMLPTSRVALLRFAFTNNTLTMRLLEQVIAETPYTTDADQKPARIDLTYDGKPTRGIYRIDNNNLTICLGRSADRRPTKFLSDADSPSRVLIVLQRGDLSPVARPLLVIGVDGTGMHQLAKLPKDMMTGSPDWSPDGRTIACDAWRLVRDETYAAAHVLVIPADGSRFTDLGPGAMPSWSPDSKRLAYCQYSPNRGVWIMDADGSNQKLLDAEGWGCDWSPVGNQIVYRVYRPVVNLIVMDVDTGQWRGLLEKQQYRTVYYNMSWSADGKFICFKGVRSDGTEEIAIVSAQGDSHGFKVLLTKPPAGQSAIGTIVPSASTPQKTTSGARESFPRIIALAHIVAWGSATKTIVVSMRTKADKCRQLYLVDPKNEQPPRRLTGQPADHHNVDMAWSPDGTQIVFGSEKPKPKK